MDSNRGDSIRQLKHCRGRYPVDSHGGGTRRRRVKPFQGKQQWTAIAAMPEGKLSNVRVATADRHNTP
jgi:hypothetical protein